MCVVRYYLVKVTDFEVGGESLSVDVSTFNTYGGMLVDSGTTELILPTAVYIAFANKLMSSYSWLGQAFFSVRATTTTTTHVHHGTGLLQQARAHPAWPSH